MMTAAAMNKVLIVVYRPCPTLLGFQGQRAPFVWDRAQGVVYIPFNLKNLQTEKFCFTLGTLPIPLRAARIQRS
jgi:hypothetical protein